MAVNIADVVPRLGPDDVLNLEFIRDGRLSPDGRLVAYVVSQTDSEVERFDIRILDLATREVQRLPFAGNATAPRWSPDGRFIAFTGDGRLHLATTSSLQIGEPLTPEKLSVQGAPSWCPDSQRVAVSLVERRTVTGPRRITSTHFRAEGIGFTDDLSQRIYIVDYVRRQLHCIADSSLGKCSKPEWSPCGRRILFMATEDLVPGSSYSPCLLAVAVDSGKVSVVLDGTWFIVNARWLPNGEQVVVAAVKDSTLAIPNPPVWVVDLEGRVDLRTPDIVGKMGALIHHDMPVWDLTSGAALTVLNSQTAYATVLRRGSVEVWRVALTGNPSVERILTGERSCILLDASSATDTLVFVATDLHVPTELWRASLNGTHEERLTRLNDKVLAQWPTNAIEHFEFASADGLEIETWFLAGTGRKGPVPTVMFIHGGPFAATGYAFRYDFHMLASCGFGMLFANFRGSAGYGDAFTRAIMGDWGSRGFPDHIGAVDAAIQRGLADGGRLGVWGSSHGGFATCWIVGHTNRFKAAVAEAAVTNFATHYYLSDIPEARAREFGGRPHEIPDVYRSRSPITYAHRCTTPTMLVHGEDDLRCPMSEAEQFYRVLRDVGCPTELVRIPRCDHMGDSCGPPSARCAQNEALLRWFRQYL